MVGVLRFVYFWLLEMCECCVYIVLGVHDDYGTTFVCSFNCDVFVVYEVVDCLLFWVCVRGCWCGVVVMG